MKSEQTSGGVDQRDPSIRNATLDELSARSLPRPESVTAVIRHHVRAESVEAYEMWLKRITPIAERFPGHRGVHIIRPAPGSTLYTVTIRFDSLLHAEDWFQSVARQTLMDEVVPFLSVEEQRHTVTGLEFWFHPAPGQKPAKRYKQFLVTLSVIFPLTLVVPIAVKWLCHWVPWLGTAMLEHFLSAATIVGLMTYVFMPRATRLLSRWLYA